MCCTLVCHRQVCCRQVCCWQSSRLLVALAAVIATRVLLEACAEEWAAYVMNLTMRSSNAGEVRV